MFSEHLGTERYCFLSGKCTVSGNLEYQFIKISKLTYTGIFYCVVHLQYRCINRVNRNYTDYSLALLILFSRNIATTFIHGEFHIKLSACTNGCNMQIGIKNFDFCIGQN